jgi:hypothetical protein
MSFAEFGGYVRACPHCQRPRRVHFTPDITGRLLEAVAPCGCPGGRKAAGICRDCNRPVEGTTGKALRCAGHKRAARLRQGAECQLRHRDERNAKWRERYHQEDAEDRALRRRRKREWMAAHPEKKRAYQVRYALRHPDKVLASYERHSNKNRPDRAILRRRLAHQNTVYIDHAPTCERCGAVVPWSGRGRPTRLCQTCDPQRWAQAEARAAKREQRQEAAA